MERHKRLVDLLTDIWSRDTEEDAELSEQRTPGTPKRGSNERTLPSVASLVDGYGFEYIDLGLGHMSDAFTGMDALAEADAIWGEELRREAEHVLFYDDGWVLDEYARVQRLLEMTDVPSHREPLYQAAWDNTLASLSAMQTQVLIALLQKRHGELQIVEALSTQPTMQSVRKASSMKSEVEEVLPAGGSINANKKSIKDKLASHLSNRPTLSDIDADARRQLFRLSIKRNSSYSLLDLLVPVLHEDTPSISWRETRSDPSESQLLAVPDGYVCEVGKTYTAEGWEQVSKDFIVEDQYLDEMYFQKYIFASPHEVWIGKDPAIGPLCITFETGNRTQENLNVLVKTKLADFRYRSAPSMKGKEILRHVRNLFPTLSAVKLTRIRESAEIDKELIKFEKDSVVSHYKFGLLYCAEGQTDENDMFCNKEGSEDWDEFLEFLGTKVTLKDWNKFRGGLDVKQNSTGIHSIYTSMHGYEIMFHVSTMLPFYPADPQQLERKRHLGNDVTIIVFKDGPQPFSPDCIHSEFNHVFIVVSKVPVEGSDSTHYRVEVVCKDVVPRPFRPLLPARPVFKKEAEFRIFLLTKLINSERASMGAKQFALKLERTRNALLGNLVSTYVKEK